MPTATQRNFSSAAQPTTLNVTVNATATSVQVPTMPGTWPTAPFEAAIERGTVNEEAWLVTNVTGAGPYTWTVTRGFDGTQNVGHNAGVTVEHTVTGEDYREANLHASDPSVSDAHGLVLPADLDPSVSSVFGSATSTEVGAYMGAY